MRSFFFGIFLLGLVSLSQAQATLSAYDTAFAYTNYSEQQSLYGQPNTVSPPSIDLLSQDSKLTTDLSKYNDALANYADYYIGLQGEVLNDDYTNPAATVQLKLLKEETFEAETAYQTAKWKLLVDAAKYDAVQTTPSSR